MYKQKLTKLLFEDNNENKTEDMDELEPEDEKSDLGNTKKDKDSTDNNEDADSSEDTDNEKGIRDRDEGQDKPLKTFEKIDPNDSDELVKDTSFKSYVSKLDIAVKGLPGYKIVLEAEKIFNKINENNKEEDFSLSDKDIKVLEQFKKISENPLGIYTKDVINTLFKKPIPSGVLGQTVLNPVQLKKGSDQIMGATSIDYKVYEDLQIVMFFVSHRDGEVFKSKGTNKEENIYCVILHGTGASIRKENVPFFENLLKPKVTDVSIKGDEKKSIKEKPKYLTSIEGEIPYFMISTKELELIQTNPRTFIPQFYKRKSSRKGIYEESINHYDNIIYKKGLTQLFEANTSGQIIAVDLDTLIFYDTDDLSYNAKLGLSYPWEDANDSVKQKQWEVTLYETTSNITNICSAKYLENMNAYHDENWKKHTRKAEGVLFTAGSSLLLAGGITMLPWVLGGAAITSAGLSALRGIRKSGSEEDAGGLGRFLDPKNKRSFKDFNVKYTKYEASNTGFDKKDALNSDLMTFIASVCRSIYSEHKNQKTEKGSKFVIKIDDKYISDTGSGASLKSEVSLLSPASDNKTNFIESFLKAETRLWENTPNTTGSDTKQSSIENAGDKLTGRRSKGEIIEAAKDNFDYFFINSVLPEMNNLLKHLNCEISGVSEPSAQKAPDQHVLKHAMQSLRQKSQTQSDDSNQSDDSSKTQEQERLNDTLERLIQVIGDTNYLQQQQVNLATQNSELINTLITQQKEENNSQNDDFDPDSWQEAAAKAFKYDDSETENSSRLRIGPLLFENNSIDDDQYKLLNQLSNPSVQKTLITFMCANNAKNPEVTIKLFEFLTSEECSEKLDLLCKDKIDYKKLCKEIFGSLYGDVNKELNNQSGKVKKLLNGNKEKKDKKPKENVKSNKEKESKPVKEHLSLRKELRRIWKI